MPGADLACSGFGGSKLAISRRPLDCRAITPMSDRKSTRLNSSHEWISYAVFCLKKKKKARNPVCRLEEEHHGPPYDESYDYHVFLQFSVLGVHRSFCF